MKLNRTVIVVIVLLVATIGLAAFYFLGKPKEDDAVLSVTSASSASELMFISLASQINTITFDATLLSDPRFTNLEDIRTAVIAETVGRRDPFAPLGVGAR